MFTVRKFFTGLRSTQLNDPEMVTWTNESLVSAFNQSLRLLILLRPDAYSITVRIPLVSGTRQQIPVDGIALNQVLYNIHQEGAGRVIRLVERSDLDAAHPEWHGAEGFTVAEYTFDTRNPRYFYVYPAVPEGHEIMVEYGLLPLEVRTQELDTAFPVAEIYEQPLQELMMYKLLSGDSANGNSGETHLQTAMTLLGVKREAEGFMHPVNRDKQ